MIFLFTLIYESLAKTISPLISQLTENKLPNDCSSHFHRGTYYRPSYTQCEDLQLFLPSAQYVISAAMGSNTSFIV